MVYAQSESAREMIEMQEREVSVFALSSKQAEQRRGFTHRLKAIERREMKRGVSDCDFEQANIATSRVYALPESARKKREMHERG